MYNKVTLAETPEDLKNIQIEMINRFGLIPDELKNFFLQAELKLIAEDNSIKKINFVNNRINISFKDQELDTSFFNDDTLEEKVEMTTNVIRAISKNVS